MSPLNVTDPQPSPSPYASLMPKLKGLKLKDTKLDASEYERRNARQRAKEKYPRYNRYQDSHDGSSKSNHKERTRAANSEGPGEGLDDDGWIPLASSSKIDMDELRAQIEEARFREKMCDVMAEDGRMDELEANFNTYIPHRWRDGGGNEHADPSWMEEEEYTEWVRQGMWRRTHREEVEAQERKAQEKREREEREKELRRKTRRLEKEEEERRRRKRAERSDRRLVDAWNDYQERWAALVAVKSDTDDKPSTPLTFASLPWPVYPPPDDLDALSKDAVASFLLSSLHSPGVTRKIRLREALRVYHPDRFMGRWMESVAEQDKKIVEEAVGRIVRALTALAEEQVQ